MRTAIAAAMIAAFSVMGVGVAAAATPDPAQSSFVAARGSLGGGGSGGSTSGSPCTDSKSCTSTGPRGSGQGGRGSAPGSTGGR
ncbi:hypothetical protein [Nocardia sp. GTS18]|uniref:hypothetical protein n=1 Tax=Nocardia sp. GTS18 TaxID=1778064 RepID=UPI0015EFB653|nr:hypothetical protein [Nocardia sp. GTS18]